VNAWPGKGARRLSRFAFARCAAGVAASLLLAGAAAAAGDVTSRAGKYTVVATCQPSPPIAGDNLLVLSISADGQPATGLSVSVHLDMVGMSMPADVQTTPGAGAGEYVAALKLSMEGQWTATAAVHQMPGMAMAGDGEARFLLETGKGLRAAGGGGHRLPWLAVIGAALVLALAVLALFFRRRASRRTRGVVAGVLTLLVVFVVTYLVVRKYRSPKVATVIGSALMDMRAMRASPGPVAVATEVVRRGPFQPTAAYTATVVPDLEEDVYPRVTGRLVEMPFYPGDRVQPGQVLARLDTAELSAKERQAAAGRLMAARGVGAASADAAAAAALHGKAERTVEQAQAAVAEAVSAAGSAAGGVHAAEADVTSARQMARESDSAEVSARAAVDQANDAVTEARAAVDTSQAGVTQAGEALVQARSMAESAQAGVTEATEAVTTAQGEVDGSQADAEYWARELERERKLFGRGAISQEELDRETAQATAAQAKLKQAQAGLRAAQAGVIRAEQDQKQALAGTRSAEAGVARAQQELKQAEAGLRSMRSGVTRSQQDVVQAQARRASARAAVRAAQAKLEQARAEQGSAAARVAQARAGVRTMQADARAAGAGAQAAGAKVGVAEAATQQADAALTEASVVRGYTVIRAASSGVVTARSIPPGTLVQPGMAILTLAKVDYVRLQATVAQADLAQLRPGQPVLARTMDDPAHPLQAAVTALFPALDPASRTALVEARIVNPEGRLAPGQYVRLEVQLAAAHGPTLSVPNSALMVREGQTSVFVVTRDGPTATAHRAVVQTGAAGNERTEVVAGLQDGAEVVVLGQDNLEDGDAVSVVGSGGPRGAEASPAPPTPAAAPAAGSH